MREQNDNGEINWKARITDYISRHHPQFKKEVEFLLARNANEIPKTKFKKWEIEAFAGLK